MKQPCTHNTSAHSAQQRLRLGVHPILSQPLSTAVRGSGCNPGASVTLYGRSTPSALTSCPTQLRPSHKKHHNKAAAGRLRPCHTALAALRHPHSWQRLLNLQRVKTCPTPTAHKTKQSRACMAQQHLGPSKSKGTILQAPIVVSHVTAL
jgi:hypothetical protein